MRSMVAPILETMMRKSLTNTRQAPVKLSNASFLLLLGALIVAASNLFLHLKLSTLLDASANNNHNNHTVWAPPTASSSSSCRWTARSVSYIQQCYPNARKLSCSSVKNWNDVQHCLAGRFVGPSAGPTDNKSAVGIEVHVVGERNSGTKWVVKELKRCFPLSSNVKVHRDFIRSKHFFQPPSQDDYRNHVVLTVFRDPVEWIAAMREIPYHSPEHVAGFDNITGAAIPLPWNEFVTKPWTMKRTQADMKLIRNSKLESTLEGTTCPMQFSLPDIIPCLLDENSSSNIPDKLWDAFVPLYELHRDRSGRPFDNILDLRNEKIVNFLLELPLLYQLGGYGVVRYEDLLRNGTAFLIAQVAQYLGVPPVPNCKMTGPQPERFGRRPIEPAFRDYVNRHVDPTLEGLLGYTGE